MISPDGKCKTFDALADGYGRSDGCGVLVLQRTADADKGNKSTYAVIKASAVLQDGKSASLAAPNGLAQEQVYYAALSDAGVDSTDISYIEAHGTGTSLGDPVEVGSLVSVYGSRSGRNAENALYIASSKANMGHMEAAAGMGGLFAAVLVLMKRIVYPNGQLKTLNDKIVSICEGEPFVFPTESRMLCGMVGSDRLLAGVSSFGYSGTISHIILADYVGNKTASIDRKKEETSVSPQLWLFAGQGTLSV
eukprot:gene7525-9637_t